MTKPLWFRPRPAGSVAPFVALGIVLLALLAGCASPRDGRMPYTGPTPAPTRPITSFASELRCMDGLLLDYGIHDVPLAVEPVADPHRLGTGSADPGSSDLLTLAVSDMTRSSRAIRLVASGANDGSRSGNTLRGALSLADDGNSSTSLSLDASLHAADATIIPGSATRHSATLVRKDSHYTGNAEIRQFGIAFALTSDPSETLQQASRALAELAAIEQIGRLAHVPYWSCLGAPPTQEAVAAEIKDWYDTLAAHPAEMIRYVQDQLRTRDVYAGPVDGAVNPQLKDAVARYREALGLAREAKISLDFFGAYLNADHRRVATRVPAAAPATAVPVPADPSPAAAPIPPMPAQPLALRLTTEEDARRFGRGEAVQLLVRPSRDAYVYCFLLDEDRHVVRFFPNRFQREARVATASGLKLPGRMPFEIALNPAVPQAVACFATERDVLARLPTVPGADDFAPLPFAALDEVRGALQDASDGAFAQASLELTPRK
jgi:peptidoglycan hydrolase-like protein with peptidoglycan-binding domain